MNGFEFVNEALSIKGNALDAIVALSDNSEVDWLEFKAAITAQSPKEATGSNEADYIFNLVKALVGMANGTGGLVVLGVNDAGDAVGLDKSGFDGDKDKFTRRISDKVLLRDGWRTASSGQWRWKVTSDQIAFNPQWAKYQGLDVLAFTVSPREASLGPLVLTHATSKDREGEDIVFVRTGGDRGQVVRLSSQEADNWWVQRDLTLFSPKFTTWIKELQKTDPAVYLSTVSSYCIDLLRDTAELDRLYVPLEADVRILTNDSTPRRYQSDEEYLHSDTSSRKKSKWRGEFQEIVTNVYPVFLIGAPGAGKSTSLMKLVRDINTLNTSDPEKWALYVQLAGFTAAGLRELICREISPLNWYDILIGLESGQLTLILDGLNECPSTHYNQCAGEVSDLFKECPKSRVVVSTRISHLPAFAQKTIELRFMGTSRQQKFVENYLGNKPEVLSAFWDSLSQKSTAQMIARSPILLRMAVWLWEDSGELPGGLAELYSGFFDAWIRREIAKDISAGVTTIWTEDETRDALALLAYSMRCDGIVACSKAYAEDRLQIALGDRSKPFIERIVQGLIIETIQNGQTIRFSHETIQEFLVAVFLTSHAEHHLLQSGNQLDGRRWSMPIVFAFELFDQPPEHFVQTAWKIAPLLVCAALRDQDRLRLLPEPIGRHQAPQNDLWVRGIIKCMRSESVAEATGKLAHLGRTPSPGRYFQKHPLPEELIAALEGVAFWYALSSYEQGRDRIERLQHLIIDRRNLWLELLPHVIVAQPEWLVHLTNAQRLLVGELEDCEREQALAEASVVELCYMARNHIIADEEFRRHWKRALNVENSEPLELEILALLSAKKIEVSQLNGRQRAVLKGIGNSKELSPRILGVLVRDNILQADEVRQDKMQIGRLLDSVSPVRAIQLMKRRVLKREDFSELQLRSLLERIENEKDIGLILESGLVSSRQLIPKSIRDRVHGNGKPSKSNDEITIGPVVRADIETTSTELISNVYLSHEQMLLKRISCEIQDPNNFPPGNGYHNVLTEHIDASIGWPLPERAMLIDMAEVFFREHASKKRQKEYRNLISLAREASQIEQLQKSGV